MTSGESTSVIKPLPCTVSKLLLHHLHTISINHWQHMRSDHSCQRFTSDKFLATEINIYIMWSDFPSCSLEPCLHHLTQFLVYSDL